MKIYELRYGETINTQCLAPDCNFEFELTLEPKSVEMMTERERYSMPTVPFRFCPFCGARNLDSSYEHGDEPL